MCNVGDEDVVLDLVKHMEAVSPINTCLQISPTGTSYGMLSRAS